MDIQSVNIKLLVYEPAAADVEPLIPVFHHWIQGQIFDELLLDIADYRHVPKGPGVILIGHQADYSLDNTGGLWGVRYNRKASLDGDNQTRLRQAACAALKASRQLENEPALGGKIRFNGREVQVFVNDRILAPNNEETRRAVDAEFRQLFDKMFRGAEYALSYDTDSRRLLRATAKTSKEFSISDLLSNCGS
jgi:hypothetical protein